MFTELVTILRRNRESELMMDAVGVVALVVLLVAGLHAPGLL